MRKAWSSNLNEIFLSALASLFDGDSLTPSSVRRREAGGTVSLETQLDLFLSLITYPLHSLVSVPDIQGNRTPLFRGWGSVFRIWGLG